MNISGSNEPIKRTDKAIFQEAESEFAKAMRREAARQSARSRQMELDYLLRRYLRHGWLIPYRTHTDALRLAFKLPFVRTGWASGKAEVGSIPMRPMGKRTAGKLRP